LRFRDDFEIKRIKKRGKNSLSLPEFTGAYAPKHN